MRTKALLAGLITALILIVGVHPSAQTPASTERKLVLTFDGNGFATLTAQNVTVAEVFAEWARVGGSKITNAERLPRNPISVQFVNTPEAKLVEALVLRLSKAQGAGFIVAPRLADAPATPSRLQTINIMPSSSPTSSYVATSMPSSPTYPQGTIDETEVPPVMPTAGPGPASQNPPPSPQPNPQPPANRGPGVSSVVPVGVVPVGPASPTTPTTPPAGTTTGPGRGRGNF